MCSVQLSVLNYFLTLRGWGQCGTVPHHYTSALGDVTFDESVPFYHLFPYRSAPPPPPPLFLAPGPPPVDPLQPQGVSPGTAPRGAASGGAEPGGAGSEGAGSGVAEPEGVEPGGAESEGAEPWGAESEGAESGGAEPRGAALSGAPGVGEPGDTRAGGAAVTTRAGDPTEPGAAGAGGTGAGVAGVGDPGARGAGAAGAGAVDPGAGGAGGTMRPRSYFVPLLQQVLGVPSSAGLPPPFLCPPPDHSQPPLQPASPLPVPSPYTEQSGGLTECREPASRPVSPVHTGRRTPCLRPPPVPGTHTMALYPSSIPLRVPLPAPPESSLPEVPDPESDRARAASPTIARLLATAVSDPSFECAAASALVAELLDFAASCRLDNASPLVAESVPASPPSVGVECALGTDVLEDRQLDFECLAAAVPRFTSLLLAPKGDPDAADIPTPRSYAECDYELHSLDFSTAFLQGSLHDEIWLRRPPGFTGTFPADTQWSLRWPVYGLRQAPREWHDTLRTTLAALGFAPSRADPSLFLRTNTSLPPFYVLVTLGMGLVLGGRGPVVLTGHADASWVDDSATQRSSQGYTFSLGSGSVSWRSTGSSSVLSSSCEAEIYAGAMAAQELCWLTYLLTELGEQPRSPPVLYVDNKVMIALCQEHRLEHIALRYFLARELQQRGQLRLAYVATRANTADVFTKALPPGDHQRFVTVLGLVRTLPHLLTA
ncbi:unnamed protein product [Closterium sp. NIES-54]